MEELYEFVQKCVRTQENLRKLLGKSEPLPVKTKTRALWEEKLNRSNMSNDDICDALIKKAMEGIKDIPRLPSIENDKPRVSNRLSKLVDSKPESQKPQKSDEEDDDVTLKEIKISKVNENSKPTCVRSTRSSGNIETAQGECQSLRNECLSPQTRSANKQRGFAKNPTTEDGDLNTNKPVNCSTEKQSDSSDKEESSESINKDTASKSFNIMDHVSMIKVNGVGILFQCKLCNRNFLKKEVVMSHACAKTGVPKIDISNMYMPPEPPKVTTVKYITTKVSSDDKSRTVEQKTPLNNDGAKSNTTTINVKKKIGPASKIGRRVETSQSTSEDQQTSTDCNITSNNVQGSASEKTPVFHLPSAPNLNTRYKLIPGPNNTFSLVEDKTSPVDGAGTPKELAVSGDTSNDETPEIIDLEDSSDGNRCKGASRTSKRNNAGARGGTQGGQSSEPESSTVEQPYPVGLFQTVRHHSGPFSHSTGTEPVPFTTPAMKKQSYTVVQTGNPSKLLISTKPQQVNEDPPKKRPKRARPAPKNGSSSQEPFTVILEDTTPPKDPGFFSFINVDPLLQPSYVLPTDNIIQESQITTSTLAKRETDSMKDTDNKYTCSICGEKFNREKKLNAHIYAHYNVEEDTPQEERTKKRSRK